MKMSARVGPSNQPQGFLAVYLAPLLSLAGRPVFLLLWGPDAHQYRNARRSMFFVDGISAAPCGGLESVGTARTQRACYGLQVRRPCRTGAT